VATSSLCQKDRPITADSLTQIPQTDRDKTFRKDGPSGEQQAAILDAAMYQHTVEWTARL